MKDNPNYRLIHRYYDINYEAQDKVVQSGDNLGQMKILFKVWKKILDDRSIHLALVDREGALIEVEER